MDAAVGMSVRVIEDGPYEVSGHVPISRQAIVSEPDGTSTAWEQGEVFDTPDTYRLCRCGHSANKPFCDSSHRRVGFDGTETATREPYSSQAMIERGATLDLTDAQPLCASARFCHVGGGIWRLIRREGEDVAQLAADAAGMCPSGRLAVRDRATGAPVEPVLEPSIGIISDPLGQVAGPIWVRGGVQIIGVDGEPYEVRNRVTLCRCGNSQNKPFCDSTHVSIGFTE